jgi:hypothetical protein
MVFGSRPPPSVLALAGPGVELTGFVPDLRPHLASFQFWNDGDAGLARAIWCLTRHLMPKKVVETGVAHGVTSRHIAGGG